MSTALAGRFLTPGPPGKVPRQGFLKTVLGERVPGCMISSWRIFWLFDAEVAGWCFRNLTINLLIPSSLWSMCLRSAVSTWWEFGFYKKNNLKCASDIVNCLPWGELTSYDPILQIDILLIFSFSVWLPLLCSNCCLLKWFNCWSLPFGNQGVQVN